MDKKRLARRALGPGLRSMGVAGPRGWLFLPLCASNAGPSRRASSAAPKAWAPAPPVRPAALTATCSWPWSSPPKSWRSASCGCARRRRSCSKSSSCHSPRNRPACLPPRLRSRPRDCACAGLHLTRVQQKAAVPCFLQRCRAGAPPGPPATLPGEGPGVPPPLRSRHQGRREHRHFPLALLACRSRFLLTSFRYKPSPSSHCPSPQVCRLIFIKEWWWVLAESGAFIEERSSLCRAWCMRT